jgi:hypothetical protein
MSFLGMLNTSMKARRRSDELLASETITTSHTLTRSAGATCCMLVTISGADTDGTVKLVGNVAGVSTDETMTFDAAESRQSVNEWDDGSLTALEPSGLTGNIQVRARGTDGQPLIQPLDISGAFPARVWDKTQKMRMTPAGEEPEEGVIIFMQPMATTLLGNDLLVNVDDTTEVYRVDPTRNLSRVQLAHHWQIPVMIED